jgi:hypothetical protein
MGGVGNLADGLPLSDTLSDLWVCPTKERKERKKGKERKERKGKKRKK